MAGGGCGLKFEEVSRRLAPVFAISGLDLEIAAGRTTALIGPSGCGKSTLLRLVVGLERPDAGRILVAGEALSTQNLEIMRRRMGYVLQEGGLFPHLSARDNVTLMARYLGHDSARIDARVRELAELMQMEPDLLAHYPFELSGGQRQRISLMRALMLDPELLLLDEPLGALDPMIRFELQQDLRNIFRKLGRTVLLVTHDMAEAGFLGDQLVLMRDGAVVQQGTVRDLITTPANDFVEQFVRAQRAPLASLAEGER